MLSEFINLPILVIDGRKYYKFHVMRHSHKVLEISNTVLRYMRAAFDVHMRDGIDRITVSTVQGRQEIDAKMFLIGDPGVLVYSDDDLYILIPLADQRTFRSFLEARIGPVSQKRLSLYYKDEIKYESPYLTAKDSIVGDDGTYTVLYGPTEQALAEHVHPLLILFIPFLHQFSPIDVLKKFDRDVNLHNIWFFLLARKYSIYLDGVKIVGDNDSTRIDMLRRGEDYFLVNVYKNE